MNTDRRRVDSNLLREAIEDVYAAFADVPKPENIIGCEGCIEKKNIAVVIGKPLRELSPDDLEDYADLALLTIGSVEDYLYFLPMILEILATREDPWPGPEIIARGIHDAGFHSWPNVRRRAVSKYFDAIMDNM